MRNDGGREGWAGNEAVVGDGPDEEAETDRPYREPEGWLWL